MEFVKNKTEICVPTLQTDCNPVEVTLMAPKKEEKCITVTTTNCHAEVEEKEIELCVYVYEKKDIEAKAKVADVKYTKKCDTTYVEVCEPKPYPPPKPKNGYGQPEEEEEQVRDKRVGLNRYPSLNHPVTACKSKETSLLKLPITREKL